MKAVTRDDILRDLLRIVSELNGEWEYTDGVSMKTGFFTDLGFESIDVVALGTAIEEFYRQPFPFAQFLAEAGKREAADIYVGEVVELVFRNLNGFYRQQDEANHG